MEAGGEAHTGHFRSAEYSTAHRSSALTLPKPQPSLRQGLLKCRSYRNGEMIPSVKCLPYKHEDLSSDPNNDQKARHGSVPVIPALGKQGQKDPGGLAGLAGPAS